MTMKWLDFSAYELRLRLVKTAKNHYLVLSGLDLMDHKDEARAMRFVRIDKSDVLMVKAVKVDDQGNLDVFDRPRLADYALHFPDVKERDWYPEQDYNDRSEYSNNNASTSTPTLH
jgi:hypothetical protein